MLESREDPGGGRMGDESRGPLPAREKEERKADVSCPPSLLDTG